MRTSLHARTVALALLVLTGTSTVAQERPLTAAGFYNVLMQEGADPWAYRHSDGYYYFTRTTGGDVTLWRSRTLTGIDAGERKTIWWPPASGPGSKNIWAPEIHYLDGKWYVYYAADDGDNANHRMYVLENVSADPFQGTWTSKGQITDSTNRWAIDGSVLVVGTEKYFLWSGWEGTVDSKQHLYIARMSSPWTLGSARVRISTPTYTWETNTSPQVNEGPQVIIRNGVISLVYSASGSWTDSYCLGLITARVGSDLLNAASWTKRSTPIFRSGNGLYGPGHHSFTKSMDGKEDWIVYHTARWPGSGWTRNVRAQRFTWNADHTPYLGVPADPNRPIPLPSGEPSRLHYEAERAVFANGPRAVAETTAAEGYKLGYIDSTSSYVEFTVSVPRAGEYIVSARTGNGTAGGPWAVDTLSVNGGPGSNFYVAYSGWNRWGNATARVQLLAGNNTLRFTKKEHYAEFDSIDVFPTDTLAGGAVADGTWRLLSKSSGKALDVAGCSTANGANVIQWPYNGGECQKWRLQHVGEGYYVLLAAHSGKALDVAGCSAVDGADVITWPYWGAHCQQWLVERTDDGVSFRLLARHSGKALDVAGCSVADGADVITWPYWGPDCQRWYIQAP
jgi:GH43 family beta-xylosidase